MLIKLINSLLPFLKGFSIYGNIVLILAYKGIEYFLGFGLKGRGLCIVNF